MTDKPRCELAVDPRVPYCPRPADSLATWATGIPTCLPCAMARLRTLTSDPLVEREGTTPEAEKRADELANAAAEEALRMAGFRPDGQGGWTVRAGRDFFVTPGRAVRGARARLITRDETRDAPPATAENAQGEGIS